MGQSLRRQQLRTNGEMVEGVLITRQVHLFVHPVPTQGADEEVLHFPGRYQVVLGFHYDHVGFARLQLHPGSLFGGC
jgi:hypothetical protein